MTTHPDHHQRPCRSQSANPLHRVVLPLLGIGSIIWFIIRVVPKPSRAAYPCMKVAAPLASTFVLWLLGLWTSCLLLKKARLALRQSRYLAAAACIATGAIAGGSLLSMRHHAAAAIVPNAPVGVAKGAVPGRVVWIHDSSATPWKGPGDGHWWQSGKTDQGAVDRMMSVTLRQLANTSTDSAAWDTLFRYFNREHGNASRGYTAGEKISIKTNLVFCIYDPAYTSVDSTTYALDKRIDYMHTSPQAVRALLRQLVYTAGVHQSDISIGDPSAYYPNEYFDSCHAEFPDVRYIDHAGRSGRTKAVLSEVPMYWSSRPTGVKQDYIPRHYTEATYLISLANMKSHMGGGITLCAKNHYGSFIRLPADSGYYSLHESLAYLSPAMGSYRALVDIMGQAHLGGKTLLYLIDGLYAGNHNLDTVPRLWPVAPFNNHWTSSLFASQDPVAIECVLFDLFQLDTDPAQYPKIAGAEDYLIEAARADNPPSGTFYDPDHATPTRRLPSLGVWEHWNNPVDRKYSRNLGTGNGIELVFVEQAGNAAVRHAGIRSSLTPVCHLRRVGTGDAIDLFTPKAGSITLRLFDLSGRQIGNGYNTRFLPGNHRIGIGMVTGTGHLPAAGNYTIALYEDARGAPVFSQSWQVSGTEK